MVRNGFCSKHSSNGKQATLYVEERCSGQAYEIKPDDTCVTLPTNLYVLLN